MNDTLAGLATAFKTHGSHSPNWSTLSQGVGKGGPQNQIQTIGCELQLPYPGFQKGKTSLTQPQTPFQARADEDPGSLRPVILARGTTGPPPLASGQETRPPTAAPLDHLIPDLGGCAINCSGGSPWGVWTGGQVGECGDGW